MATPVTISPLTQLMVGAYDDSKLRIPSKGFQTLFARNAPDPIFIKDSESLSYDIIRKGKTISKMLTKADARSLGDVQKTLVAEKYQNVSAIFPDISEASSVNWAQTLKRVAGEEPYGGFTRMDRLRILLVKNGIESMSRIAGRIEKMAVESLTLGKITLDDTAEEYDFNRSTNNTFAAPALWTAASTPLVDLDNLARAIAQNGGMAPNFVVFGRDVVPAFIDNANVEGYADIRRYSVVEVGGSTDIVPLNSNLAWMLGAGFNHIGNVRTAEGREFPILNYLEQYQTDAGVWTDYMDPKAVFMGYSDAPLDRYFGPSEVMEPTAMEMQNMMQKLGISATALAPMPEGAAGVLDPRMFDFDFDLPSGAQTGVYLRTHTSPLYIPKAVDAFGKITAVVA